MTGSRHDETNHARSELYETLALLSDRLNYAQRFDDAVAEKKEQLVELKERKPIVFAVAVASVAVAVGTLAWGVTRAVTRRIKN